MPLEGDDLAVMQSQADLSIWFPKLMPVAVVVAVVVVAAGSGFEFVKSLGGWRHLDHDDAAAAGGRPRPVVALDNVAARLHPSEQLIGDYDDYGQVCYRCRG